MVWFSWVNIYCGSYTQSRASLPWSQILYMCSGPKVAPNQWPGHINHYFLYILRAPWKKPKPIVVHEFGFSSSRFCAECWNYSAKYSIGRNCVCRQVYPKHGLGKHFHVACCVLVRTMRIKKQRFIITIIITIIIRAANRRKWISTSHRRGASIR